MAKAKEEKNLDWQDVDPESVEKNKAYAEYKAAQKLAAEKRGVFEENFIDAARKKKMIAPTQTLRFSYRFGKLAVAVDALEEKKEKAGLFKL